MTIDDGAPGRDEQLLIIPPDEGAADSEPINEAIERPAKVMRIGSMIKQLLDELHQSELDPQSRARLREVYEQSVQELSETLSPDLTEELGRLTLPFSSNEPSDAELRVAQAQLVGWLEGLFHGIQATLFAQQVAAQAQLDQIRQRGLPPGARDQNEDRRPGNGAYL